jgi:hypothetical protein
MNTNDSLDLSRISDAQLEASELSYRRGYLHAVAYLAPDSDYYEKVLRWRYAEPMQFTHPPDFNEPLQ